MGSGARERSSIGVTLTRPSGEISFSAALQRFRAIVSRRAAGRRDRRLLAIFSRFIADGFHMAALR